DPHLPDHAHRRDPGRRLRAAPVGGPIAVQGVPERARCGIRTHLRFVGAAVHGAVADPAPRGVQGTARAGLLVVRPCRKRGRARRVPGLPPRTGSVPQALRPRGPVRARDDGSIRHLTLSAARTFLTARYFAKFSGGKERSREEGGARKKRGFTGWRG